MTSPRSDVRCPFRQTPLSGLPRSRQGQQRHAVSDAAAYHQGNSREIPGGRGGRYRDEHILLVSAIFSANSA